MSVYKRENKGSSTWMIDFAYIDPTSGQEKRYRRAAGKEVTLKRDALALERELREQLETPPPKAEEEVKDALFADFAGYWKDARRADWKPSVYHGYEIILRVHLVPAFGSKTMRSISVEDVQRYKAAVLNGTGGRPHAPKTVNNHLGVLSALFEDAVKWRYCVHNPVRQVKPCRSDRDPESFHYWTAAESDAFLDVIRQRRPRWYPLFLTALRTGLRLGELAALRWEDVDFERGRINVRRSYSHGVETRPKNGRGRALPMSPQLREVLLAHRGAAASQERVFLSAEGKLLDPDRVKHPLWYGTKIAGVRSIRFHDLRHSFASQLVIAGVSLYKVQELLGHQDSKMTMRYAHLSPEAQADAVQVLDRPALEAVARLRHAGGEGQG